MEEFAGHEFAGVLDWRTARDGAKRGHVLGVDLSSSSSLADADLRSSLVLVDADDAGFVVSGGSFLFCDWI